MVMIFLYLLNAHSVMCWVLTGISLTSTQPFQTVIMISIFQMKKLRLKSFINSHKILLHPWNFSGKDTGVGCHFLL